MKRRLFFISVISLAVFLAGPVTAGSAQGGGIDVLTQRYNIARTGANNYETILNPSNVNAEQFGKLFTRTVVGDIYAQPLYVRNLEIPGKGKHNVVYVATMHNMVYAFDADDPALSDPLWQVSLGTPVTQGISEDVWGGEDGVLSTPTIDLITQTLYLVSHNSDNGPAIHKLHALDLKTGSEKFNGPVAIQLSVRGQGLGSKNGRLSLDSTNQLQRPALLLLNGFVYMAWGGNHDNGIWHGWLAGYNATNLKEPPRVFTSTPNGFFGGIWMSGGGIASDGTFLYLATGNGTFKAHQGGTEYSDSFLKLKPAGRSFTVVDWFTPYDEVDLDEQDFDFGSTGAIWIPGSNLVLVGGKDGKLYIADRNKMGRFNPNENRNVLVQAVGNDRMYTTPVYWNTGPGGKPTLYAWTVKGPIRAFAMEMADQKLTLSLSSESTISTTGFPPGALTVSSNGSTADTGILWAVYAPRVPDGKRDAVLYALKATDLSKVLWHSEMNTDRDAVGIIAKFNPPVVVNGKVYVASFSNRLNVYGLLNRTAATSSGG
jgi:hypothetical protein